MTSPLPSRNDGTPPLSRGLIDPEPIHVDGTNRAFFGVEAFRAIWNSPPGTQTMSFAGERPRVLPAVLDVSLIGSGC